MMPYILYHKTKKKARGAAEIMTAAGIVALTGAAIASACMLLCGGAKPDGTRVGSWTRHDDVEQVTESGRVLAGPSIQEESAGAEDMEVEVIRYGAPYTTEYDYGMETEQDPEQIKEIEADPEESAVVMFSVEPEEDGPRVEPPASTAVDAPAEAGPAIPTGSSDAPVGAWTDVDEAYARMIAQVLWGECRGCSVTEQAAVAWCVLNRVDSQERYFPDDVAAVIVQPSQFLGYAPDNPVTDELYRIARDVLSRWYAERAGASDVGRVLPGGYCFFWGDGRHNYFTTEWRGADVWDWSLGNPYGEG